MAIMAGRIAKVIWDGGAGNSNIVLAQCISWTADLTHDTSEVTAMAGYQASGYWRTFHTGFQSWTASVECYQDTAGTLVSIGGDNGLADDITANLELYFNYDTDTTLYNGLNGVAICSGMTTGHDKDDIATISYSFQGNGQLAWFTGAAVPTY